jgi:endonuclease-3
MITKREQQIFELLKQNYPAAKCGLDWKNPFELLIATILSAQCTDKKVNSVTPELFQKFPNPEKLSKAEIGLIENHIRSIGLFRNKAKSLKAAAIMLHEEFHGSVPQDMAELTKLPGVGRKTANVVLSNAFDINSGIAVDTHVFRLAKRLELSKQDNPEKTEKELMEKFPQDSWGALSHLLITHGRQICHARKPDCNNCFLAPLCTNNTRL